jgi:hypothetical protein
MDGKKLTRELLDWLDQSSANEIQANQRRIYEMLDLAAGIFCRETYCLHGSATITTVEDQQYYDLPPDFIELYMKSTQGRYFIKYYNGSMYSYPLRTSYEKIFRTYLTSSQERPSRFAIIDKESKEDLIQGTVDANGAQSRGECTLQDDDKLFTSTHMIYPRDVVHNETDGSTGYVLSVTDATHLKTALFLGVNNQWALDDAYTIQPAAEKQLVLDYPSATAGHVITIPYVCMPAPIYSEYGFWRFPPRVCKAIAAGGATLYQLTKLGDEARTAPQIGGIFEAEIKRMRYELARANHQDWHYRKGY